MRKHPASKLERMAVEQTLVALGGLAHVRQHRFARDEAAQSMKQLVPQRVRRALGDVWRAVDVVSHAPAVRVGVALGTECVLRLQQGGVDLARDDAAKTKESAHAKNPRRLSMAYRHGGAISTWLAGSRAGPRQVS